MTMDPISDMLTTIRNGLKARLYSVEVPASRLKGEIARVMKDAGYIADYTMTSEFPRKLVITLKYTAKAKPAITKQALPHGRPTMLRHASAPNRHQSRAVSQPPQMIQSILPMTFMKNLDSLK